MRPVFKGFIKVSSMEIKIRFSKEQIEALFDLTETDWTEEQKQMISDFFVDGQERKQVAEIYGVSRGWVSRITRKFITEVKDLKSDDITVTIIDENLNISSTGKLESLK